MAPSIPVVSRYNTAQAGFARLYCGLLVYYFNDIHTRDDI